MHGHTLGRGVARVTSTLCVRTARRLLPAHLQTGMFSNENMLVCAPTGAGKTNIAMISVLREVGLHRRDGVLHKDEFKIVYVAPMKALAAEVTRTFGTRLESIGIQVRPQSPVPS